MLSSSLCCIELEVMLFYCFLGDLLVFEIASESSEMEETQKLSYHRTRIKQKDSDLPECGDVGVGREKFTGRLTLRP